MHWQYASLFQVIYCTTVAVLSIQQTKQNSLHGAPSHVQDRRELQTYCMQCVGAQLNAGIMHCNGAASDRPSLTSQQCAVKVDEHSSQANQKDIHHTAAPKQNTQLEHSLDLNN